MGNDRSTFWRRMRRLRGLGLGNEGTPYPASSGADYCEYAIYVDSHQEYERDTDHADNETSPSTPWGQ